MPRNCKVIVKDKPILTKDKVMLPPPTTVQNRLTGVEKLNADLAAHFARKNPGLVPDDLLKRLDNYLLVRRFKDMEHNMFYTEAQLRFDLSNFIHPTAIIGPNVTMGKNNYIGPYCVIGYPAEHKAFWQRNDSAEGAECGEVEIGDNNVFTGHVTVDTGTERATVIRDDCFFMKHSHVGHDVQIYHSVTVSCGAKIGGHSEIMFNVNIGLNAVLHQRSFIDKGCMIGMGAVVTKGLRTEAFSKYAGVPAKWIGVNNVKPKE